MRIAVPRESRLDEQRVALLPDACQKLSERGFDVVVQTGAGSDAGFDDDAYRDAGARVADTLADALASADVVLKVQPPSSGGAYPDEVASLPAGAVLIGFLSPLTQVDLLQKLAAQGVTAFSMEAVPRITRAQKMDALSSQATVAGYRAALIGATELGRFLPMLTTAAGTIRPSKVLVLGAGVAGLQAIATARRLGAVVEAFDVRPAVKEQVQSLGAKFLEAHLDEGAEDEGGYAKALSEEQHEKELQLIAAHIDSADIVITTAQIPGKPAPLLITRAMVESMKPGSVIVDLAADSGGNCELSESGKRVEHDGVLVLGPRNLPSTLPVHASQMYSKNITAFLDHLIEDGALHLDFEDEITSGSCVTHDGQVRFGPAREVLGLGPLTPSAATAPEPDVSPDASQQE